MSKPKADKLTVALEPATRGELEQWAAEEGRPVANLLRRIVARSLQDRRAAQQEQAA